MRDEIKESRQRLMQLFDDTLATDRAGTLIELDEALSTVVKIIQDQAKHGSKIYFIGNGGSAAIASHMATDFWKNAGIAAQAFNDSVLITCISNDNGYKYIFEKSIEMFAHPKDLLIAISSSGMSENILRGVQASLAKGMRVITLSGFGETNPLRRLGEINFYVPAAHYGHVEVIHHALCHCLVDTIINKKGKLKERVKIHD